MSAAGDPFVGRTLGEFVLRERIGEGGFGAVYRAVQPALEREAVIKVLHAKLSASKSAKERFLREAKLASKLDHPYAAHVYAFGAEADGALWIAMELVRGTPLDQVLKHQGPLTLERFVALLDRICEVVHTAHEAGIVHRDLKPANVMVLSRAGRLLPKLLDFGIAKGLVGGGSVDETIDNTEDDPDPFGETLNTPTSSLTVQGTVMGSPPYMAPEQWMDAAASDARTDLYALGILAFECVAGRPPFSGANLTQIAKAHATGVVPPLGQGAALDKVLKKALAKIPAERFQSALEFAAAFRKASGIVEEATPLPALDPAQRDLAINGAPQPIAEAIAAFEASRNAFQARDALVLVGRTIARYLGLLALACRTRVAGQDTAAELIRTLHRRALTDREWIELARTLTAAWVVRRDAYPIPELITALHDDGVGDSLEAIAALRDAEAPTDDTMLAVIEAALAHVAIALEGLAFLRDYPLVVPAGNHGERWMGVRRAQRLTIAVRGKGLPGGAPALLDRDGVPVLTLSPLFQIAAPSPGAPLELFLFEGRDRRGAKLVALPGGFEQHDDALWDWFRAQLGGLDEERTRASEEAPPYRGLAAFGPDDAALFVGREKQVDAFVNRLRVQPLLAVVGPSGAGKSSFVHAGAAPALGWRTVAMRPGPSPLASLVARLEHAGIAPAPEWTTGERAAISVPVGLREAIVGDREALGHLLRVDATARGPILVVVDQLEEMFTLCTDADERRTFAEALAFAARAPDDGVRVVFTLRDDFLVRTEQVGALRNRIGQGLQLLTVPAPDDLLRIVVEPARRYGYEYEGDLAKEMVKEVADQPGSLALISFAASVLWELRDRHFKQLTRSAYKMVGGVGGALAKHAEQTLDGMPPEERALTREAFRHLVTSQNTRAVLGRRDLRQLLGNDAHADGVIEKLIAARLLVASESEVAGETVEIIHEALLATWPRLAEWRREDSEGLVFREQLRSAAKQWDERGRAKGLLWRGDALAELTRWRARASGALTDVETAFADASLTDAARGRRNVRIAIASAFAVLGAGVVVLLVLNANVTSERAKLHDSLQQQSEDRGRNELLNGDPQRALAYLETARELGASGRTHDFLVAESLQATDGEILETRSLGAMHAAMFSHDGTMFMGGGNTTHEAFVWDAATGARLHSLGQGWISAAGLAPDDRTLLLANDAKVSLIDPHTGATATTLVDDASVRCAAFSPDGARIGTTTATGGVALWGRDGKRQWHATPAHARSEACAFSANGALFAQGDSSGAVRMFDVASGALLHTFGDLHDRITDVAFSPDSSMVVAGGDGASGMVWRVESGERMFALPHRDALVSVAFSPDGTRILTGSLDRAAAIWDAKTGAPLRWLSGHTAGLTRARFSPDGAYVVTASEDASAWLWDAETGNVAARWRAGEERVRDVAFDREGKRLVTANEDGRVIVLAVAPQRHTIVLRGHEADVFDAKFSPDGTRIATGSDDRTARIWNADSGALLATIHAPSRVHWVAWAPDGSRLATFGLDGMVRLWDVASARELHSLAAAGVDFDGVVDWGPSGIVAATSDGWLRFWNADTGGLVFERRAHEEHDLYSAAFSRDGRSVITTGGDGKVRRWDLRGEPIAALDGSDGPVSAQFDPSGAHVLSAIQRERAKIWNPTTGATEHELVGHLGRVLDASWSHDGRFALTISADATARIWDAQSGDMLAILPQSKTVVAAQFSPDDSRVVSTDGNLAVVERLWGTPPRGAALEELIACRVPWIVDEERLVGRAKADCLRDHRR